jgi:hypothetical protein
MSDVPTIPDTSVQSASGGVASTGEIGAMIAPISAKAVAPLPDPYMQGVQVAEPHQKQIVPYQHQDDNRQPISNQATSVRIARHQNAVAGLANMIGQAGQKIQERKQANLKDKLVDVMKAKQNVANAKQVLQQDPNNAMAKSVLQANTKQLNDILSDPKHQKELAKALDISYVDPEKNKTPEVQAYQQATSEFKKAGIFNSDNPTEHKVAEMASAPPKLPEPSQPKLATPMGAAPPQLGAPTQPNVQKSTTPYADAALAKDMPTIEPNPQYAAAVQQQKAAQEQLSKMIPSLIKAESEAQLAAVKDANAGTREQFKAAADFRKQSLVEISRLQGIEAQDKTRLQQTAMRDSAELATAQIHAAAIVKVANINGMSKQDVTKLKQTGAADYDKKISVIETSLKTYGQREADIQNSATMDKGQKEKALNMLNVSRQQDQNRLAEFQKLRAKDFPDIPPPTVDTATAEPKDTSWFSKLVNGWHSLEASTIPPEVKNGNAPATSVAADKPQRVDAVGADESDEDPEDDSDKY